MEFDGRVCPFSTTHRVSVLHDKYIAALELLLTVLFSCADTGRKTAVHIVAGNKGSTGPFAPIVRITRDIVGTKEFNKLRGKAISLHSQVIKDFCKQIGVDTKQVQGLIRLAKKNGEKLGFLA